jgi:acylpyruvate hydrolase
VSDIIAYTSSIMRLEEGDLILTGTPAGVGRVVHGDALKAELLLDDDVISTAHFDVCNE